MTAAEIADELFHCGKQVKQCLLIQAKNVQQIFQMKW